MQICHQPRFEIRAVDVALLENIMELALESVSGPAYGSSTLSQLRVDYQLRKYLI